MNETKITPIIKDKILEYICQYDFERNIYVNLKTILSEINIEFNDLLAILSQFQRLGFITNLNLRRNITQFFLIVHVDALDFKNRGGFLAYEYELKMKQEWDLYLVKVAESKISKLKIKSQKDSLNNISPKVVEECQSKTLPYFESNNVLDKSTDSLKDYLLLHIKKTMMYPEFAMEHNIQGAVFVSFVINKEGFVSEIEAQGPENGLILENEAIRIIEKLPKFIPSKCDGQPVDFQVKQAISFKMLY